MLAVNKIMKEYADVIAETHNMPDLSKYTICAAVYKAQEKTAYKSGNP